MVNEPEPLKITQLVTNILDSLAVPYVIGGSMASITYGTIRLTMDVDLIAGVVSVGRRGFGTAVARYPGCLENATGDTRL